MESDLEYLQRTMNDKIHFANLRADETAKRIRSDIVENVLPYLSEGFDDLPENPTQSQRNVHFKCRQIIDAFREIGINL